MTDRYRTNLGAVPPVQGLARGDGWVDMQVQFLLDQSSIGTDDFLLGWSELPPGARHDPHVHRKADEFLVVLHGSGRVYIDGGTESAGAGDVIWTPRGQVHGFKNTGDTDTVLLWGWRGCGSLETSGYEVVDQAHG